MAEPQRASLPASSPLPRLARPPHPSPHAAALSLPLDETQDLSPSTRGAEPLGSLPPIELAVVAAAAAPRRDGRPWRPAVPRLPSRSPGEWVLMAVVLLGLALNASSLLASTALSRSDRLLGSAVFLVGLALLVLMEVCRRNDQTSR